MSIVSGRVIGRNNLVASTDNTVANPAAGTKHIVTTLIVHERGGGTANVDLFLSGDASSDTSERIERLTLGANEAKSFSVPIGVTEGQYLIIQSDVGNVNYRGLYTYRDGADV